MVEVLVAPEVTVEPSLVGVVARAAEAAMQAADEPSGELSLTIVLADDAELARLNQQFRGVEGPTDVLSFESEEDFPEEIEEMHGYLGDVVISVERAAAQAAAAGRTLAEEAAVLAAHGTLHLLGYDHAEDEERRIMWDLQDRAAADATR